MNARVRAVAVALVAILMAALVALAAPALAAQDPNAPPAPASTGCAFGSVACAQTAATPTATDPSAPVIPRLDPRDPNLLSGVAQDTAKAAATVLSDTLGWWFREPSLPIEGRGVLGMQAMLLGLAAIVLTLLVIVQGIRMIMTRKGAPFAELIRGMVVASLVIVMGVALIDSALIASDRIADGIIKLAFPDSDALVQRMVDVTLGPGVTGQAPVLLLVFSLIVLTAGLAQAVLLFVRECAIPMLGAVLPIAAVGQAGPPATQAWLPKLLNLVVALVLFKPVVALILCLGFVQFAEGTTLVDAIRGSVMMALSVAAFPMLLRLFAPATYAIAQRGGHGLAVLGPMGLASTFAARGAGTPGDTTAVQHAAFMQARGPSSASVVRADAPSGSSAVAEAPSASVVAFPRLPGGPEPVVPPREHVEAGETRSPVVVPLRGDPGGPAAASASQQSVNERSRHGSH